MQLQPTNNKKTSNGSGCLVSNGQSLPDNLQATGKTCRASRPLPARISFWSYSRAALDFGARVWKDDVASHS